MALVNLFSSVVAPAANQSLQVLKTLFRVLDLPAEAMTYALFNILEEVDWKETAEVINCAAASVVNLHRGSYILGGGSLYPAAPFSRIASDLLGELTSHSWPRPWPPWGRRERPWSPPSRKGRSPTRRWPPPCWRPPPP